MTRQVLSALIDLTDRRLRIFYPSNTLDTNAWNGIIQHSTQMISRLV